MKVTFLSNTSIKDIEDRIRSLRPKKGISPYDAIRNFPTFAKKEGFILRHWAEEDDGDDTLWAGFALPIEKGWTIFAASGLQKTTFVSSEKGTFVTYDGPLMGIGDSPYTRHLFTSKEVMEGKVEATGFKGSLMGYLNHRLYNVVKVCHTANGEQFISGCGLPTILQSDIKLYLMRKENPVEGYEDLWPGTIPKLAFSTSRPKGNWAELIELRAYPTLTPGERQLNGGPKVPKWITEAI